MAYFWYPAKASFVRCFAGMASLPKIGRERERERPKALSIQAREKDSRQNQMDRNLLWDG